jgi:hypothetical protein
VLSSNAQPWREFGFKATAFAVGFDYDPYHKDKDGNKDGTKHPYQEYMSPTYGRYSIMDYHSLVFQRDDVNEHTMTVNNVPLVGWTNGGPDFTPPAQVTKDNAYILRVNHAAGPSLQDVVGAKYHYPWEEP